MLKLATPTVSMIPPGTPGYRNLSEMYPNNPAKAKELNTEKCQQIGHDLQRYVAENMYWGTLTGLPIPIALQRDVRNFRYRDHFKVQFEDVWIARK